MSEQEWHILAEVEQEMERGHARWGGYHSSHEGLGVLMEEVAELVEAVRLNDLKAIRFETIQIAAVAARMAYATEDPLFRERSRP